MKLTKKMMNAGSGIYIVMDQQEEEKGNTVHRWLSTGHFAIRADVLPSEDRHAVMAGEDAVRARWGDCEVRNTPVTFRAPAPPIEMQRTGWIFNGSKHRQRLFRPAGVGTQSGDVFVDELYQALLPDEPTASQADDGAPNPDWPLVDHADEPRVIVLPIKFNDG